MKKYSKGLVIGRFQPFHLGHKYLIEEALKVSQKLIIGIGSSNISDRNNPYSYEKRKKFLEEFIKQEGLENRVIRLVPIVDDPDDAVWLDKLKNVTGKFDVGIGDNEWVNGIFEANNIPVLRVGHYDRDRLEGTTIRDLIKNKKNWKDRIPKYLVEHVSKQE